MAHSSDDEEDQLQYLKKEFLQGVASPPRARPVGGADNDNDDDSNHLFMSEPSISEADEHTTDSDTQMRFLSPAGSFSDDGDAGGDGGYRDGIPLPNYGGLPPHQRMTRLLTPVAPASPGNTSLSSWESPHIHGRPQIHVHYSPGHSDSTSAAGASTPAVTTSNPFAAGRWTPTQFYTPQAHAPADTNGVGNTMRPSGTKTPDRTYNQHSSNSTSPASEGQQRLLENFLDDLRLNSQGQMQEANGANTSLESSLHGPSNPTTVDFNGILRKPVPAPYYANPPESRLHPGASGEPQEGGDDTVVMVLSEDESFLDGMKAVEETGPEPLIPELPDADAFPARGATPKTTRIVRSKASKPPTGTSSKNLRGHRRQRSGDRAAAVLSTGSKEWKGMEQDKIPLPPVPGGHDDDDDYEDSDSQRNTKGLSTVEGSTNHPLKSKAATPDTTQKVQAEINRFSSFALGSPGQDSTNRRSTRSRPLRSRRNPGLSIDTEDSSSIASSGRSQHHASYSSHASIPASAFSGYLPSPDWSGPNNAYRLAQPSVAQLSPRVYQNSLSPPSMLGLQVPHPPSWTPDPRHPGTHYPDYVHRSFSAERINNQEYGNVMFHSERNIPRHHESWFAHQRQASANSSYSWFSAAQQDDDAAGGIASSLRSTELSPLMGTGIMREALARYHVDEDDEVKGKPAAAKRSVNFLGDHPQQQQHQHRNPFQFGKRFTKADRQRFLPRELNDTEHEYQTFLCPVCNTRQREFFSASNAPAQFESASGYIAFYFGIYVVAALYIFGLQEGWGKLDCIYFAVITLTTAGLGDFVPTTDGAKVVCSVFIYFGVACIGLLLGSYIAGMLDESSRRAAKTNRIKSCPNCVRIKNLKDAANRRRKAFRRQERAHKRQVRAATKAAEKHGLYGHGSKRVKRDHTMNQANPLEEKKDSTTSQTPKSETSFNSERSGISRMMDGSTRSPESLSRIDQGYGSIDAQNGASPAVLSSPSTSQILRRQGHSRHESLDLNSIQAMAAPGRMSERAVRKFSVDIPHLPATIEENDKSKEGQANAFQQQPRTDSYQESFEETDEEESSFDDDSFSSTQTVDLETAYSGVKNAQLVFETLREALMNSLVIIGFGCFGFFFIEGFTFIDSWYFTTVLLTTVGYGDLVPYTKGGKLFATVYILVAGTILLNNMSLISMIPLELRRRRIEKAVLTQFGDSLDDTALRELATGPVIRRLNLATDHALDECTREMFCLAMLVRLGKVTEADIKLTLEAFRKLDVNDEKVLNSRAIIAGMIQKRRSSLHLNKMANEGQDAQSRVGGTTNTYGTVQGAQASEGWYPVFGSSVTPSSATSKEVSSGGGTRSTDTPESMGVRLSPRPSQSPPFSPNRSTFWNATAQSEALNRGGFSQ